jgi:hypothetical protein
LKSTINARVAEEIHTLPRVIHTIHRVLMQQSLLENPLHRRKPVPTADMGPAFAGKALECCVRQVQQIGHGTGTDRAQIKAASLCSIEKRPSLRPDLPSGRAPRAAAVKDVAANAAAPAQPARSVLDRASTVLG